MPIFCATRCPGPCGSRAPCQDLLLFYHREVPRGESFALSRAQTGEKQYYFNGEREGKSAFEASITFA